jgi:hypothetical protein
MGSCRGGRAICSREWLTAPPYVLLPQQEVTELLKLRVHVFRQTVNMLLVALILGSSSQTRCFIDPVWNTSELYTATHQYGSAFNALTNKTEVS